MNLDKAILITFLFTVFHVLLALIAYLIFPINSILEFDNPLSSIIIFFIDCIILALVILYLYKIEILNSLYGQLRNSNVGDILIEVLIGLITVLLLSKSTQLFRTIFNLGDFQFRSGHLKIQIFHILDIISFALIGPITEELIFRGYIQNKLHEKFKTLNAVLLTSVLFGLYHAPEWLHVWTVTIFAILIGMVYAKRNKLIIPIMWHITWNSLIAFSKYFEIFK